MTNRYISTLSTVRKQDIKKVGGKGANLGELAGKGFPVPSGFVVSAEAYSVFLDSLRLQKILQSLKKAGKNELSRACGLIRNTITNASFPGELAESILAAHHQLIGNKGQETVCAVRSSATTEDLSGASFAGQHATYYYVERANLLRMIQYCWASLWSKEAVSYRNACGIDHSTTMAVVIQEMVRSEISGITFTANPVTQANEVVIEASWGMGAAIVDGRVTPDRYILDHNTLQVLDQRIAEKNVMVPNRLQPETASRLAEVPPELQQQQTLSPELLKTVASWALKAETHFGSPQNMEWAISGDRFYILQSRAIASIAHKSRTLEPPGKYVLFKPAINGSTAPFTPLTTNLMSLAASPLLRPIHGHCYLNLKYLRALLPFKLSDRELVDLVAGLSPEQPEHPLAQQKISLFRLLLSLPLWLGGYFLFGVFFARTRNMPENFSEQYKEILRSVEKNSSKKPLNKLLRLSLLPKLFDPIGSVPLWLNIVSVRHLFFFIPLRNFIARRLPALHAEASSLFRIKRSHRLYPEAMQTALEQLTLKAGQFPAIREQFFKRPPEQVIHALKKNPNARPFLQLFNDFIEQQGYRATQELELQSVRWEENQNHIIKLIRERLLHPPEKKEESSPEKKNKAMRRIKQELGQSTIEKLFHPRWYLLLFLHKASKRLLEISETSLSYHLMAMSIVRKKLLILEEEFLARGALRCKGDIFFLHFREIMNIQQGLLGWPDIEEVIHQRRHDLIRATRKTPPRTIGVDLPENSQVSLTSFTAPRVILPGQTASPGSYTGRARVILDHHKDTTLLPGEILVAPYTDPSWTPLFLIAGGAVIEIGSYLSHAGTAAREYTLPCIVDVAECTKRIQDGDLLWINGEKGEVHILEAKNPAEEKNAEETLQKVEKENIKE
ncbi:MAG: PEP/pyruvate-binding domain-containing protein [Candidatus Electrothrix aestuarii]|uniref:PEP/pyruvate-binding domain-containing protein n=1 Tax=Candidatus Electrothrix aestuarii TaxID=3062594 RepID=A0AAU8LUU4_9BACT|nr:PEP/pyruvate-binding domain-containing protein [Candidatus Electrothrix aestuarii]